MKVGNSLVLVLPKQLCDIFQITKGKECEILATNDGLFIPLQPQELDTIKETIEKWIKERSE